MYRMILVTMLVFILLIVCLSEFGIDIHHRNKNNHTAVDFLAHNFDYDIGDIQILCDMLSFLIDHGVEYDKEYMLQLEFGEIHLFLEAKLIEQQFTYILK